MALNKRCLRGLIEYSDVRNVDGTYTEDDVMGVSTDKRMFPTKADLDGVNLRNYKLFFPGSFAYVADTSRRGDKIALAYNNTDKTYIVSTWYVVFKVCDDAIDILLPDYLYLFFNRSEFDRYARTNSWGSAREYFWFADMEDVEIELPPISIQQKYVDIYKSMIANQQSYERGLEDLKLVCDGYIEDLRRRSPCEKIGPYLVESDQRNSVGLSLDSVRGIATSKELIPTKANMDGVSLDNYKVVKPRQFAYVADTSRRGDRISLGLNDTQAVFLVSSISTVFGTREERLLPEYLMLYFTRAEFDRYTRFNSWGSARETFDWGEMCNIEIPIPDISVQKAIAQMYSVYVERKRISEQLKAQIKDICPILIKGSLEEGTIQ